jgi:hypothetical protein
MCGWSLLRSYYTISNASSFSLSGIKHRINRIVVAVSMLIPVAALAAVAY